MFQMMQKKFWKERNRMNKTVLQKVRLVNWYGFHNATIPISENLTLISGENECGKSTILDAIKYAYTGDTQFNKATSAQSTGTGKRNLVSYTRCLTDASAGIYARPAEKIPVVYTHIALEYYDQINEHSFILGVIIETAVADIRGNYRYAMDGKTLDEIAFVYKKDEMWKPYDASGFQKKYGIQLKSKKDGITLFMQMMGLKIPHEEVPTYQRKLRNIMAYNPAAKIQEFIRESVLEEKSINFDKLKEAKNNIHQITTSLEQIQQELQDLDSLLQDFDEHDKKELRLKIDDSKRIYQAVLQHQKERKEAEEVIKKNMITCEILEQTIARQEKEIAEIEIHYEKNKSALHELDVSKAILASEQLIRNYNEQLAQLNKEKEALELFQKQAIDMLGHLTELEIEVENAFMIEKLTEKTTEAANKQRFLEQFKVTIQNGRDHLVKQHTLLEKEITEIQTACNEQTSIIENCNKNKADYSHVYEYRELIREINREFEKREISEKACMACEYVVELKEEAWRDAIEAFLGIHRYAIIVSAKFFDIANSIMDASKYRHVELVNTKRLMQREFTCEADAVFHFLDIRHEETTKYFQFWLGKIHAVDVTKVPNYDNAMSKEGKLSRNMAVSYLNKKKIRSYCLGSQAIELNKRTAEARLGKLEKQERELLLKQRHLDVKAEYLQKGLDKFKEYNLNVHKEVARITMDYNEEKKRYRDLIKAQEHNVEFMELNRRVTELGKQLEAKKKERGINFDRRANLRAENDTKTKEIEQFKRNEAISKKKLEEKRILSSSVVDTAIEEYDSFLMGISKSGGMLQDATRENYERRVRELEGLIVGKQHSYNNRKQEVDRLDIGLDKEALYQKRRGKIWIDDLLGIQQKLKEQTQMYERIFKREFVSKIYSTAKDAKEDIADINKELRKLQFSTRYQFDVRLLNDSSDYAKILRYAKYLEENDDMSNDGQMTFTSYLNYDKDEAEEREKEIRDIINKIIDKNDLAEIKRFADYRNYMSYEIIINNEEVKDGKLSKQVGYNSGAGTQIPYTLILSAALSMLYNARVNSVRLIFIDEPFEKMSDHNIKLMLDFFKNQNFQVIFCAPPNKLESIGSECGVIIPVLKKSNDNMQIGQVKFHEQ